MKRIVVFGAGGTGRRVFNMIKNEATVVAFVDNDANKWGKQYDSIEILNPEELKRLEYDEILLGTLMGLSEVKQQLNSFGIPMEKLNKTYVELSVKSRVAFLKRFAERAEKENIEGAVAEAGVFRGEFAKEINFYFQNRDLYLFDTFEGFDERDFKDEKIDSMITDVEHLKDTSVEYVLAKMPNKDKCNIMKGFFPDSIGSLDRKFAFVNLDMDLYRPTLEGLRYFYPRMSKGGVILIHDYFTEIFPNVEKCVDDFEKELGDRLSKMPIGDDISIAIVK